MSKQKNELDTDNIALDIAFGLCTAPLRLADHDSGCGKIAKVGGGACAGGAIGGTGAGFAAKALGLAAIGQAGAGILGAIAGCCFGGILCCYACNCNPCSCSSNRTSKPNAKENDYLLQEPPQQKGMKK